MAQRSIAFHRYHFALQIEILINTSIFDEIVNDGTYETAIKSMKIVRKHSGDDDTHIIYTIPTFLCTYSGTVEFTFY